MSDFTKRLRQIESENSECSILAGNCADAIEIEQKKVAIEIARLRAENEKLRAELEAIKSPPDYGTQKTMNEQLHYASVIAQKDREIEHLRSAAAALNDKKNDNK